MDPRHAAMLHPLGAETVSLDTNAHVKLYHTETTQNAVSALGDILAGEVAGGAGEGWVFEYDSHGNG